MTTRRKPSDVGSNKKPDKKLRKKRVSHKEEVPNEHCRLCEDAAASLHFSIILNVSKDTSITRKIYLCTRCYGKLGYGLGMMPEADLMNFLKAISNGDFITSCLTCQYEFPCECDNCEECEEKDNCEHFQSHMAAEEPEGHHQDAIQRPQRAPQDVNPSILNLSLCIHDEADTDEIKALRNQLIVQLHKEDYTAATQTRDAIKTLLAKKGK